MDRTHRYWIRSDINALSRAEIEPDYVEHGTPVTVLAAPRAREERFAPFAGSVVGDVGRVDGRIVRVTVMLDEDIETTAEYARRWPAEARSAIASTERLSPYSAGQLIDCKYMPRRRRVAHEFPQGQTPRKLLRVPLQPLFGFRPLDVDGGDAGSWTRLDELVRQHRRAEEEERDREAAERARPRPCPHCGSDFSLSVSALSATPLRRCRCGKSPSAEDLSDLSDFPF